MTGLRVYIRTEADHSVGSATAFYSRKGGGPLYQWLFDPQVQVWRCSRISSTTFTTQAFHPASWKSLSSSLRSRLKEHYIE